MFLHRPRQVVIDHFNTKTSLSNNIKLHWNIKTTEKEKDAFHLFSQNKHITDLKLYK